MAYVDGNFGIAVRNPIDAPRKKVGVQKAVGRAKSNKFKNKLSIVYDHGVLVDYTARGWQPINNLIAETAMKMALEAEAHNHEGS